MSDDVFERTRRYTRTWRSCGASGGLCFGGVCCCRVDFFLLRVRTRKYIFTWRAHQNAVSALEQAVRYVPWNRVRCEPHRSSSLSHVVPHCLQMQIVYIYFHHFLFTEGVRNIASARTARLVSIPFSSKDAQDITTNHAHAVAAHPSSDPG